MTDDEALSHLLDGDLPPEDAARMRARLDAEPALRARYDGLVDLVEALGDLEDPAPPQVRVPVSRWPVRLVAALALAAAALVAWVVADRGQPEVRLEGAQTVVDGQVILLAGEWEVAIDGRVGVGVEPAGGAVRASLSKEEVSMNPRTLAAGLAGAALTVTVYEGRASVRAAGEAPVELAAGQRRSFDAPVTAPDAGRDAGRDAGAEPLRRQIDQLTAELEEVRGQLEAERLASRWAQGRLEAVEGVVSEWGAEVPDALRPERFEAELVPRVASLPGVELAEVDCAEYPCLVSLRYTGADESMAWGDEVVDEVNAWAQDRLDLAGVVAAKSVFADDGETFRYLTVGVMGAASDAVEQRTRARMDELAEAQAPAP